MFLRHKSDNEEWITSKREEINEERKTLLEEKEKLADEWARLRKEREDLNFLFYFKNSFGWLVKEAVADIRRQVWMRFQKVTEQNWKAIILLGNLSK